MTSPDDPLGVVRQVGARYEIVFERRLGKPADQVWAALTIPERLADWFLDAEVDLRLGGIIRLSAPGHTTSEHVIVELSPPRVIAWTWPHPGHPHSVVRFELTPEGDGCRLILVQTDLEPGEHMISIATGWHVHLEGLEGAAEAVRTPFSAERQKRVAARYVGALPL
jgi:uncharacterized protein YndB with AHSA1/START domain